MADSNFGKEWEEKEEICHTQCEGSCPRCGSTKIDTEENNRYLVFSLPGEKEDDENEKIRAWKCDCRKCGYEFVEVYKLVYQRTTPVYR